MSQGALIGLGLCGASMCLSMSGSVAMAIMGGDDDPTSNLSSKTTTLPSVQYVKIAKPIDTEWNSRNINLMEVYVYNKDGTNVALNSNIIPSEPISAHYKVHMLKTLVDGNDATLGHVGTIDQNDNQPQKQFFIIDFGSKKTIKTVKLVDRDLYPHRLVGVKVMLLDDNKNEITTYTSPALTLENANAGLYHTYDIKTKTWTHSTS